MFKELWDRLQYALIAMVVGALVAGVLWFMLQQSWSMNSGRRSASPAALMDWVRYGAGISAVLGFVLKDKAADVLGGSMQSVQGLLDREQRAFWPIFLVALGILAMVSYWNF